MRVNRTAAIVRAYQDITRRKELGETTPQEPLAKEPSDASATPAVVHTDWKSKLSHLLEQYGLVSPDCSCKL